MSSNLWSKKVDLQKAFEIIVSENAGHLEACDSIRCTWNNLLAKFNPIQYGGNYGLPTVFP